MISYPFNSEMTGYDEKGLPQFDRAIDAEKFREWTKMFYTNGVSAESTDFLVTANDGTMTVNVSSGKGNVEGVIFYETQSRSLQFQSADVQDRIDTVVIRLDELKRTVDMYVVKGTPAVSPVAPALNRPESGQSGDVYELGIADVYIPKGGTSITQERITDTRLDNNRCGLIVGAIVTLDTTQFYTQLNAMLASYKTEFEKWFETIKGILDEDAAGNLLNEINSVKSYIEIDHLDITVSPSAFTEQTGEDIEVANYPFKGQVPIDGVMSTDVCEVWTDQATADLGILSLEADTYDGGVYIWTNELPEVDLKFRRIIQRKENLYDK